jgi:hypothetical protein
LAAPDLSSKQKERTMVYDLNTVERKLSIGRSKLNAAIKSKELATVYQGGQAYVSEESLIEYIHYKQVCARKIEP